MPPNRQMWLEAQTPPLNAGTSCCDVKASSSKRAGWRQMKPKSKEKLEAFIFSCGEDVTVRKTTVLPRADAYQALKENAGGRNVSNLINKILIEFLSKKESMFGTMKATDTSDLKDHRERT